MPKQLSVQIEPIILKYARKYSGYSVEEVAKKTKIKIEKLKLYEEQKSDVSLPQLEKFSKVYKRPLAFFLLSNVPADAVEPKDFRIVYKSEEVSFSPSAYLAIRRARYVQSTIAEIAEDKFKYEHPNFSIQSDPEEVATWFRKLLDMDVEQQQNWRDPAAALREWKSSLEKKDIFVLQQGMSGGYVSAFSLVDKTPYVIVLNSAEHENRRIFSLFHEIGHILIHKSGICSPEDLSRNSLEYIKIEKFCNQFAASLLVPKQSFVSNVNVTQLLKEERSDWSDESLVEIARQFKVSKDVILRRFLTLGYINEHQYDLRHERWFEEGKELIKTRRKGVKIPMYIKCLSQNGRAFISLVLDSYHSNKIAFSTASDILNINPKHMQVLEAQI